MIKSHRQENKHGQNDLKLRKIFIEYLILIHNDVIQKVYIQTHRQTQLNFFSSFNTRAMQG